MHLCFSTFFLESVRYELIIVNVPMFYCVWILYKNVHSELYKDCLRICTQTLILSMLRTILNRSWKQHPTKHQLYGHPPPVTKTIKVRRTRHAGHCWRSRDEVISDVLLWTPSYGRAKAGRPARTYIPQLCEDTGCSPEDLPEAMNDREEWLERVRDIRAGSTTLWWWWWAKIYVLRMCYIQDLCYIPN